MTFIMFPLGIIGKTRSCYNVLVYVSTSLIYDVLRYGVTYIYYARFSIFSNLLWIINVSMYGKFLWDGLFKLVFVNNLSPKSFCVDLKIYFVCIYEKIGKISFQCFRRYQVSNSHGRKALWGTDILWVLLLFGVI